MQVTTGKLDENSFADQFTQNKIKDTYNGVILSKSLSSGGTSDSVFLFTAAAILILTFFITAPAFSSRCVSNTKCPTIASLKPTRLPKHSRMLIMIWIIISVKIFSNALGQAAKDILLV